MKKIILDSGSIITLSLSNNLLWLLEKSKKEYNINFYITESVKKEIIDTPINIKKFKFEALQVMSLIDKGIIELINDTEIPKKTLLLLDLANTCFTVQGRPVRIVHFADISTVVAFVLTDADAIMIDERTTRYLFEKPEKLRYILSHKLHAEVEMNKSQISELKQQAKDVKFIRSAEFVAVAFEKGMLDGYLPNMPDSKKILLDALLWGLKLNGCAISNRDLETLMRESLKARK